ncbi:MAG: glycosyltransferase family 9 protein [Ignavibacteriaceae bacterium]|nr:glycosyltransferase family 9 protein [Ignavibacteriaceae bacterium]
MILRTDCRHFPGDHPCIYNKLEGILCDKCSYYNPVSYKILIIKLDAIGDVLRTTSILHAIKKKYPDSHITWLTKSASKEIFKNNYVVDNIIFFEDPDLSSRLFIEEFDLLLSPDTSPASAALASAARAKEKKGYKMNQLGKVIPVDDRGIEWLEMGAFDQFKKANKKSYQQIIHEILDLDYARGEIIINLDEKEKELRDRFYVDNHLDRYEFIIGINTGASHRWRFKQWRREGYQELISLLGERRNTAILLYGGYEEKEMNQNLKEKYSKVINTGHTNNLREFFALTDLSDIMITGDTMALHAATALKKKVICLFGPTSSNEIEDYGRISKITPTMDCLVCYKQNCDFVPNCMDSISADIIYKSIIEIMKEIQKERIDN